MRRREILILSSLAIFSIKLGYAAELDNLKVEELAFEPFEPNRSIPAIEEKTLVVRTARHWAVVWNKGQSQYQNPPEVDFSKNMVIGVFLGMQPIIERPKVFFTSLTKKYGPERIEAYYTVVPYKPPSTPGMSLPSFSAMYVLVLAPASNLPVQFIETIND